MDVAAVADSHTDTHAPLQKHNKYTHARTHARTHAHTHSLSLSHTHTHTHSLTRTHTHTHAHTHTHTHGNLIDETLWWDEVVTKIEKQMLDTADEGQGEGGGVTQSSHLGAARFGTWLSDRGILQIISNVYEEKLVADYVCRRKREPIQPLPSFVWNFMLCQYGDRVNAAAAMQQLVGSVLRRVRVHPVRSGNRLPQARHRMLMFARFLGFNEMDASGKHVGPLSLTELEVYLIMLGIARQGQCPLLEAGMSQMQADKDVLHSIVDVVFR